MRIQIMNINKCPEANHEQIDVMIADFKEKGEPIPLLLGQPSPIGEHRPVVGQIYEIERRGDLVYADVDVDPVAEAIIKADVPRLDNVSIRRIGPSMVGIKHEARP